MSVHPLVPLLVLTVIGVVLTTLVARHSKTSSAHVAEFGRHVTPSYKSCVEITPFLAHWFGLMAGIYVFFEYLYQPQERQLYIAIASSSWKGLLVSITTALALYLSLGTVYVIYHAVRSAPMIVPGGFTLFFGFQLLIERF